MFWDKVAGVYDIFVNVINSKTHQKLKKIVSSLIGPDDTVLECACGTGLLSAVNGLSGRWITFPATTLSQNIPIPPDERLYLFRIFLRMSCHIAAVLESRADHEFCLRHISGDRLL